MFMTYHVIKHVFIQSRSLKYQLISKDLGWTVFLVVSIIAETVVHSFLSCDLLFTLMGK